MAHGAGNTIGRGQALGSAPALTRLQMEAVEHRVLAVLGNTPDAREVLAALVHPGPAVRPRRATRNGGECWQGPSLTARAWRRKIREWGSAHGFDPHWHGMLHPNLLAAYRNAHGGEPR